MQVNNILELKVNVREHTTIIIIDAILLNTDSEEFDNIIIIII